MTDSVEAFKGFFPTLRKETDRAAAVLGAAFLDFFLEVTFRKRLVTSLDKSVFENNGPLGTFSSRTLMMHALGWIDQDTRQDLDLIRRIRNDFAHNPDHELSFSSPQIASRTKQLKVMDAIEKSVVALGTKLGNSPDAQKAIQDTLNNFGPARLRFEIVIMILTATLTEAGLEPAVATTKAKSAPTIAQTQLQAVVNAFLGDGG